MSVKQIRFSANDVYGAIKPFQLTVEQAAAVEQASVDSPSLVVAGAGSGKTELMAVRVLWLVANGIARPEEILGLTFTRKAAAELSKRIYESLLKLRDTHMWPDDLDYDFTAPNISTYNAYANKLFRDYALSIGYEPEAALLTEAAAYQLARDVVLKQGSQIDARLADLESNLDSIVENVLALAQSMNDNLTDSAGVQKITDDVRSHLSELPKKAGSTDTTQFGYMADYLQPLTATPILAALADAYRAEKQRAGFVDYSDQVALAERAVREVAGLKERERETYSQVLLDEYQDTSFLQTRLLRNLFGGMSVFAVGDPNQSIYGWRGASASNLSSYFDDFDAKDNRKPFNLSTSWRNPTSVLSLANDLIGDLKVLELKPAPKAGEGAVQIVFDQDINAEAESVASWFKQRMQPGKTGALLMRKRSNMRNFVEALEAQQLEVEVVGLGGLMEMPEVVDLICALRVIHNPTSGTQLIRLLSGPRWRIGAKDLERLHRYASRRARIDDELRDKQQEGLAAEDAVSLVDALDLLLDDKDPQQTKITDVGLIRMRDAAILLRNMRQQSGMSLLEYVRAVEQELWLDVEVLANPRRKNPMAHLNAFAEIVAGYASANNQPTLGGFLNWLDFADERERFEAPTANPSEGVVQVLTVHAAKGLEWHNVAVANLVDGDFPSTGRGTSGWLSTGKLPFPLRGDSASLPKWNYRNLQSQPDVKKSVEQFKDEMRAHLYNEELRLIYVAVTRPKSELLLSGSYWKPGNKNSRKPSSFLVTACEKFNVEIPEIYSQANPLEEVANIEVWPLDPLGERHRIELERAKSETLSAIDRLEKVEALALGDQIQRDIDLLLREREDRMTAQDAFELPVRIPASSFKDYIEDFAGVAARIKRPMPQPPYVQTRAGTLFHGWVEKHFDRAALMEASESQDANATGLAFESIIELQENFAKSRWAKLTPIDVEREIQMTIGENTFICKLDAVFATDDGVEIVDWKTGKAPKDAADEAAKTLQLALYRLAYSRFTGMPIERIQVSFYFVADDKEIRPATVPGESELLELWSKTVRYQA